MKLYVVYKDRLYLQADLSKFECETLDNINYCKKDNIFVRDLRTENFLQVLSANKLDIESLVEMFPNSFVIFEVVDIDTSFNKEYDKEVMEFTNKLMNDNVLYNRVSMETSMGRRYMVSKYIYVMYIKSDEFREYIITCPYECYIIKLTDRSIVNVIDYTDPRHAKALELKDRKLTYSEVRDLIEG